MRGFTLIELIFVILIISILSITATKYLPDNTLITSTDYLLAKIKQKHSNAIGLIAQNSEENSSRCIIFTTSALQADEKNDKTKYTFSNKVSISADIDTICFDDIGRMYKNDVDINKTNLLNSKVDINLSYNNKLKTITIHPISGFAEVIN